MKDVRLLSRDQLSFRWCVSHLLVFSPLGLQRFASLFQQLLLLTKILRLPLQLLLFVPEFGLESLEFLLGVRRLGVQSLGRQQGVDGTQGIHTSRDVL